MERAPSGRRLSLPCPRRPARHRPTARRSPIDDRPTGSRHELGGPAGDSRPARDAGRGVLGVTKRHVHRIGFAPIDDYTVEIRFLLDGMLRD